jgi:hypothetical protein
MGSSALQIVTEAYRHHNLDEVTSFSTAQEFPYNIAKDILNQVIREMNRLGSYWFCETKTALPYSVGVYQYSFNTLAIDPKRVIRIRKEATDKWGNLKQSSWYHFQRLYRSTSVQTAEPTAFSKFGDALELNVIPDQDYSLYVYHFKDMPLISATSDTFLLPERDEDILIDACYQILGYKLGRWGLEAALQAIALKVIPLLADNQQDVGMPYQMPAAF